MARPRLALRHELLLALPPTATVLIALGLVQLLARQQLLFASLASSAFLIYLDPRHEVNSVRTLLLAQLGAAVLGWGTYELFGAGFLSAGLAMLGVIALMLTLHAVHPPATSTAVSFALRAGDAGSLGLFAVAVGITAVLVLLQRATLRMLRRAEGSP